jgi:GrpB-like predicted nucleotidyltransferase (UPF0157 family)/ribosomal protein S18 acetylase RimI-like enzyme
MDPVLAGRLREVGIDPESIGDPFSAWLALRDRFGARITLVDRYALEAAHRGIAADDLGADDRDRLAAEVMPIQFPGFEVVAGSTRSVRDPVEVMPCDPAWPDRFALVRQRLADALGDVAVRIEHVGSTAVPGLAAKPIVDIQVSVGDVEDEPSYLPGVERAAAELRSREHGHRYFRPAGDRPRDVQVHVCEAGSEWERTHLLFRDYLRSHDDVRDAYGALKLGLAERFRDDRLAYTDAKSAFILDALDDAREWAARTGWEVPPYVRRMRSEEWSQLRDLRLSALRDTPLAFGSTYERELAYPPDRWRSWAADAADGDEFIAVAVTGGRWAAMARGSADRDDPRAAFLTAVYVAQEWRGQGLGREVSAAVIEWARELGFESIRLHVADWNGGARRLYESLGFLATGATEALPHDPSVTEHEMRLALA